MEKYVDYISMLAKGGTDQFFSNSGESHALEVFVQMFKNAKLRMRIFAGTLTSKVPTNPRYIREISEFIEKGGKLEVILTNANDNNGEPASLDLIKRLAFYKLKGKDVSVYSTDENAFLIEDGEKPIHFAVGDEHMYRIETDIVSRTARCNFGSFDIAGEYLSIFDKRVKGGRLKEVDLFSKLKLV